MAQWSAADAGSPGLRAALGEVLARLRRAAVDGVVPEHVFIESVRTLALGDAERERLRQELARLGLPVRELQMHTGGDQRGGGKVAQGRAENVFPRLSLVQNLLARYADADGYVTPRVVDGVVRLTGLGAHEAAQLRARALVRDSEGEPGAGNGEGTDEPDTPDDAEDAGTEAPEPGDVSQGDLAESVRRRAEEAEQEAAQRIAQSEHDAWLRITDLRTQLGETQAQLSEVQAQLAAVQEAADRGRGSLRDRWRRS